LVKPPARLKPADLGFRIHPAHLRLKRHLFPRQLHFLSHLFPRKLAFQLSLLACLLKLRL
jgi:hypothetical protein